RRASPWRTTSRGREEGAWGDAACGPAYPTIPHMRLTLTIPAAFESSRAQLAGVLAHDRAGARSSLAERTHEQSCSRTERSPAAVIRRTDSRVPQSGVARWPRERLRRGRGHRVILRVHLPKLSRMESSR